MSWAKLITLLVVSVFATPLCAVVLLLLWMAEGKVRT